MHSSVFRTNGPAIDLSEALVELAERIKAEPEDSGWVYLDCGGECGCADLVCGAYWALAEWHGGQWSPEYRALSALGDIFKPGYADGPEPDSPEHTAYELIGEHFARAHKDA